MTAISVTAFTDTGLVRSRNEDALLVGGWLCQSASGRTVVMTMLADPPFVAAVADGMGGHAGGDLASRVALGVIADVSPSWQSPDDVVKGLQEANDRVFQVGQNPDLRGMGTTVAGICVLDSHVVAFNVGDSRVYSLNSGFLQQVSEDDAVLDGSGRPTSTITQALGQRLPVEPHITLHPRDGTDFLLCSDGVSGMLTAAGLRAAAMQPGAAEIAEAIITATRQAGAEDNFSFALLSVSPSPSQEPHHDR
ncbi:PP2C family serine/threonine-protein phosphatase [Mycolicibacterium sp. F2034L]|uniref:PP2C family protein-serine/threonine phosphatase n=1 Tax=Mycolicibacterium sp. F2034L TaxID=2926422 RepID=UPI001FF1C3A8|nr:protein phosphatase 2C domain-containing protein [Mycolicibacterium sp. F2034L]MCK0177626.1 protein phosphatase 2C domain-containing protein [Mycolicibacterium sp. F2034L]